MLISLGHVYVTGFTDDRSRFRSTDVYLHNGTKEAIDALRRFLRKKRIPREIYLDYAKQFIAEEFKAETKKLGIKLIFGKPHHPRGRGKIERYRGSLVGTHNTEAVFICDPLQERSSRVR